MSAISPRPTPMTSPASTRSRFRCSGPAAWNRLSTIPPAFSKPSKDKLVSDHVLQHNRRFIPGGISSVNRAIDPAITFVKGEGAHLWDAAGKRYIDYHAGFAPYFLGHNFR